MLNCTLPKRLLSVDNTRLMLGGIGRTKLYDLIKAGELKALKLGRRTMFDEVEVIAYINDLGKRASSKYWV